MQKKKKIRQGSLNLVSNPHSVEFQGKVRDLRSTLKENLRNGAEIRQRSKISLLKLGESNTMFFCLSYKDKVREFYS